MNNFLNMDTLWEQLQDELPTFPTICKFCGSMVKNVDDYLDNHLFKHFPVMAAQLRGLATSVKEEEG